MGQKKDDTAARADVRDAHPAPMATLENAAEQAGDPAIGCFLDFLAQDMTDHPDTSVVALPTSLLDRAIGLTVGISVDLDAEIDGDVAL